MKKYIAIIILSLMTCFAFAQTTDSVLKFLGIPVDGKKSDMIVALKNKGFRYNPNTDLLVGEFNGENVKVFIHTNHNRVDRIYVAFPPTTSENDIRIKYNRLISQFDNNSKYTSFMVTNEPISMDENISYEMSVNDKQYQASYRYMNPDIDQEYLMRQIMDAILTVTPKDKVEKVKAAMEAYIETYMNASDAERESMIEQSYEEMKSSVESKMDPESIQWISEVWISILQKADSLMTGEVWFMIHRSYGQYNIGMYYDNLTNRANGEDL